MVFFFFDGGGLGGLFGFFLFFVLCLFYMYIFYLEVTCDSDGGCFA